MKLCLWRTATALVGAARCLAPAARAVEPAVVTVRGMDWDHLPGAAKGNPAEKDAGVCLPWTGSGSVMIQARRSEGVNAVVSGVFIDVAPAEAR